MEILIYKEQSVPLFPFSEPNQSVIIAKDEALIKDSTGTVLLHGNAEVRLDLLPRPRIHVLITNIEELDDIKKFELSIRFFSGELVFLELKNHEKHIKGFVTEWKSSNPKDPSLIFSSSSEPIFGIGNDDTHMQKIVFHLFNFKEMLADNVIYPEHVHLEADNLVVELKSLTESENNFKKLKNEGDYGLTHIGCFKKRDDTFISGKEAIETLHALQYFFSFAKGAWCNPVCAVGFDLSENRVWESWSSPIYSCSQNLSQPKSWFDAYHSEQIENLFPGFMNHWNDQKWNDTFQKGIYWYLSANISRTDAGIILTQSALERLSYEYFKGKTGAPTDSASASYKLRQLFSSLNIPIDITENTPDLKKMGDKWKWDDAPHALTEMRNYLVHPKNKYHPEKFGPAIYDAWNLGLWYLELSLLNLCGYSETYANRLNQR